MDKVVRDVEVEISVVKTVLTFVIVDVPVVLLKTVVRVTVLCWSTKWVSLARRNMVPHTLLLELQSS